MDLINLENESIDAEVLYRWANFGHYTLLKLSPICVILTNVDLFSLPNGEFPLRHAQIVRDPGDDGGGADGDLGQPRGPGELEERAAGAGPVPGEVSLVWHDAQLQRPLLQPSQLRQDAACQDPLLETLKRCLFYLNTFHYIYCL